MTDKSNACKEIERAVLAVMLTDYSQTEEILSRITEGFFFSPEHRTIFRTVKNLYKQGMVPTLESVITALKETKTLEHAGGTMNVADLVQSTPSSVGIETWIEQLTQHYVKRRVQIMCNTYIENDNSDIHNSVGSLQVELEKCRELLCVRRKQDFDAILDNIEDFIDGKKKSEVVVLVPYYLTLDRHIIHPKGETHMLGATPGTGKTGFVLSMMLARAKRKKHTAIFCAETPTFQLIFRLVSIENGIGVENVIRGATTPENKQSLKETLQRLREWKPYMHLYGKADYSHSATGIIAETKKIQQDVGGELDIVCVDYLQNMRHRGDDRKRNEQIEDDVFRLSAMFGEVFVAGIILCQLNRDKQRDISGRRFYMSDFKGSSAIEQEADIVSCLERKQDAGVVDMEWYSLKIRGAKRIDTTLSYDCESGALKGTKPRFSEKDRRPPSHNARKPYKEN